MPIARLCTWLLLLFLTVDLSAQSSARGAQSSSTDQTRERIPDLAGDWQGKLGPLRAVLRIVTNPSGGYCASFYSIDQGAEPIPVNKISLQNSRLHLSINDLEADFEGRVQPNGMSIRGTWKQPDGSGPLNFVRPALGKTWLPDASLHSASCITVAPNVQLEVLDWGGTGRPLVLLAGLGDTAHAFDTFAPKLTSRYHVYGITRRGYGASSVPDPAILDNYTADRLGDDVLAVLTALKLNKPVLVGHSIAGEELSSISSRHANRVAGFIYLDAAYGYAHYDSALGDYDLDRNDLRRKLNQLTPDLSPKTEQSILMQVQADLPRFQRDIQEQKELDAVVPADDAPATTPDKPSPPSPGLAILLGQEKYTSLSGPILAIFAIPHKVPNDNPKEREASAAFQAFDTKRGTAIANSFEHEVPNATVVRIRDADHYVYRSNEADIVREINSFINALAH